MKIIVFQGIHSGVGTSSLCAALSFDLSRLGHCVLCVDADIQSLHSALECIFNVEHKENGWIEMAKDMKPIASYPIYIIDSCNFIPRGSSSPDAKDELAAIIQNAVAAFKELKGADYVFIDAGVRGSVASQELSLLADMVLTVACPDSSSLIRLDECELKNNEFIVLNKLLNGSNVMREVCMMLDHSAISAHLLKQRISFNELVMQSLLMRQPFTRLVPQCSAAGEIRKLSFKLIDMCHPLDEGGAK